jgi:hypothetical protein
VAGWLVLAPLRDALLRAEPILLAVALLAYAISVLPVAWRWHVTLAAITIVGGLSVLDGRSLWDTVRVGAPAAEGAD